MENELHKALKSELFELCIKHMETNFFACHLGVATLSEDEVQKFTYHILLKHTFLDKTVLKCNENTLTQFNLVVILHF